jgi:hypothetical protein
MPNGNYHLWYASTTANAIYLSRMYLNGTIGPPVKMKDADQKWEEGWVENPAPYVADGRLVMLYSAGNWKTKNYRSRISICETECTGFEVPWLASGDGAADAGPGGASIFKAADGRLWVAWHSFSGKKVGPPHPRRLHVQPLNPKKGSLVLDP